MKETATISAEKTGRFSFQRSPSGAYLMIKSPSNEIAICDSTNGQYLGSKEFGDAITKWCPDEKALAMYKMRTESVEFVPVHLSSAAVAFDGGTSGNPWEHQHVLRNLEDCFEELTKQLPPAELEQIKNTKESELFRYTGGPGLGMQLRNTWGLRGHTPLAKYFNSLGITDGAAMSTMIIESFWRHLNSKPTELEKQVEQQKFYADCDTPILKENAQLPDTIAKFQAVTATGAKVSIESQQKKKMIVSFICTKYGPSEFLLSSLSELRKTYSPEQLPILVFTFTPEVLGIPREKDSGNDYDCSRDIARTLADCRSTIPSAPGSPDLLKSLIQFARNRLTPMSMGMPQTLIINDAGLVTVRFNGWPFDKTSTKWLEKVLVESSTDKRPNTKRLTIEERGLIFQE
jgi:hypothetical protein